MEKLFFKDVAERIRKWVDDCREETHDHYASFLPGRIGFISSFILSQFFSGIRLDRDQTRKIQDLPQDSIVVYAVKQKSCFEYLFYHTRYNHGPFPFPAVGFDHSVWVWQPLSRIFGMVLSHIVFFATHQRLPDPYHGGYYRQKLLEGYGGMLSLVGEKGFYRRFVKARTDPARHLIEMQRSCDRPIFIVPQLMFFGRNPMHSVPSLLDIVFGPESGPGILRRVFTLFRNPGKVFVEVSEPVNLRTFLEAPENRDRRVENLAMALRRRLLHQINRHRQSLTGPVLKSREELKESILTHERLRTFMEFHAKKREVPIYKVRKEADGFLDEIAAKYSTGMIRIMEVLVGWIIRTMFDGTTVNTEMLGRLKTMSQRGPLILIPCHKSHIDYLILSYLLYNHNMPCPHIAAGKNLSFWPLGPIFRSGGAFFIRRTFKGALLYATVFAEYIHKLLEEGFNIEFFIEGGRSRTGKMILPKLGLLSTILNAYRSGACEDLIFVPIYIGYDRVLEESAYLNELEGGEKEAESLVQVIKARKFLKKRYGRIYIKFHDPLSLNDLLGQMGLRMDALNDQQKNALCRNLGHRIINAINQVTVVTPHAIVAAAMLNIPKKRFSYEDLMEQIETYMTHLAAQRATLAETLIIDPVSAFEKVVDTYVQRKFIEKIPLGTAEDEVDAVYTVNEGKRPNLEYYKNNCISFFVSAAFSSLAILDRDAFQFSSAELLESYSFQQEFFKDEFAYDVDRTVESFVRKDIKSFIDDAILIPHPTLPDTYNLTSAGFRKLKLFAIFLRTYYESYWVVITYFKQADPNNIGSKDRIKKIVGIGARMYKKQEIERKEALSEVNYKNAVKFFTSRGINGSDSMEKIDAYAAAIQRYLSLLNP